MIWWIVNAFLWSISSVIWKKSLELNKMSQRLFMFLWVVWWILISIFFISMSFTKFPFSDLKIYIAIVMITLISIAMWYLTQYIYKNEKISVLLPYSNIDRIIIIIAWFLFFSNASLISFVCSILATISITLFSLDFWNMKLPKNIWLVVLNNILSATKVLSLWWLFLHITSITFYSYNTLFYSVLLLIPILKNGDYKNITKWSKEFFAYRIWAAILGQVAAIIWFFLLEKLWVVVSNLISFLWMWITLLFSYIMLKDKPQKKDVIQAILLSVLVSIWYYFR